MQLLKDLQTKWYTYVEDEDKKKDKPGEYLLTKC